MPGEMLLEQNQERQRVAPAGNGGDHDIAAGKVDLRERGRASRTARDF
jgi:hypothetical protein